MQDELHLLVRSAVCFPSVARKVELTTESSCCHVMHGPHCVGCMACQWNEVPLVEPDRNESAPATLGERACDVREKGTHVRPEATVGTAEGAPGH